MKLFMDESLYIVACPACNHISVSLSQLAPLIVHFSASFSHHYGVPKLCFRLMEPRQLQLTNESEMAVTDC